MNCTLRRAERADIPFIRDIYNDAILNTTATFDYEPKTMAEMERWYDEHDERHPILVAVVGGRVCGWTSLSRWSDRAAYDGTVELSVYVHRDYRGQGIGRKLMAAILAEGRRLGLHTVISRIEGGNAASIHLHTALGFRMVGVMKEVGYKFGRWLDVAIMQLMLNHESSSVRVNRLGPGNE
ncbi:MAG: N-acetyltransferase [Limnochordales bacterium]|nr:N-acetyltransferase [Limnochordales bacterium]